MRSLSMRFQIFTKTDISAHPDFAHSPQSDETAKVQLGNAEAIIWA